jgi:putative ABC transport system ATP-binding protein
MYMTRICLTDVSKIYQKGTTQVPAVREISLEVEAGAFVVLMGVSGSGKSTLLNLMGGLDKPTSGSVEVFGTNLSELDSKALASHRRRVVGFVFQSFHLIPTLTVVENVMLALAPSALDRKGKRQRALELAAEMGLKHRATHFPGELSGGEQQRVAIARALANNPSLLLADEPTSDLDTATGNQIIELLRTLNAQGKTIVLATHDETLASAATHLVRMRDGRITGG